MTIVEIILLIAAGLFSGVLNTLAGGGSLITLPLLIFMGLPSAVANASNRVAIFTQNIFAVQGFKSKGVSVFPFSYWLTISATVGAAIGAYIAVDISGQLFNRILAIIMVIVIIVTSLKAYLVKKGIPETFNKRKNTLTIFLFFGVGIYGGFIQAGIGFLVIALLTNIHGLNMAKTNAIKVFTALGYTGISLVIFHFEGVINWEYGLILAIGNAAGAWMASRWSVGKDDKWIQLIMIVTVFGLAIKLWFF